eukprot:TRINITY_DN1316_c0_g1_i4.p2 TRINITY_DN1316_c0_g1~~TRINITY_DN1316_c0_g1_i4.p2  ORF type:complete len:165 (-),score=56.88 TRINITY_DN1316_c0_g1_i4:108-557(-)
MKARFDKQAEEEIQIARKSHEEVQRNFTAQMESLQREVRTSAAEAKHLHDLLTEAQHTIHRLEGELRLTAVKQEEELRVIRRQFEQKDEAKMKQLADMQIVCARAEENLITAQRAREKAVDDQMALQKHLDALYAERNDLLAKLHSVPT